MKDTITLEKIFSEQNIARAMSIVTKKDVMPGLDGMHSYELPDYWETHRKAILSEIDRGLYIPTPLNLFFLPKPGKKEKRQISVCTVLDQMLQHCIRFELERYFTPRFHSNSFGFIKGKGTQDALNKCLCYMNWGMTYVIDADIRKCFDNIKHRIVANRIGAVSKTNVVDLISKYLKNPGKLGNGYRYHRVGLPQGSSMSPVIANIVLNSLDWYLFHKHIAFVRYADDLVIFCRTKQAAVETLEILSEYLQTELSLRLNQEKTAIVRAHKLLFLGHSFSWVNGKFVLSLNEEQENKMIGKMEKHLRRTDLTEIELLDRIGAFNRGWLNYYAKVHETYLNFFIKEAEEEEIRRIFERFERASKRENKGIWNVIESKGFVLLSEWQYELKERGDSL